MTSKKAEAFLGSRSYIKTSAMESAYFRLILSGASVGRPCCCSAKTGATNACSRRAMRRIDRDNIKDLIIDVSLNGGGMTDNIYYTLDYFTDRPIEMNSVYHVTDNNRELIQTNIERSETIKESDRERLVEYVGILESGTVFCTDTVCDLQYLPQPSETRFRRKCICTHGASDLFGSPDVCPLLPDVGDRSYGRSALRRLQ